MNFLLQKKFIVSGIEKKIESVCKSHKKHFGLSRFRNAHYVNARDISLLWIAAKKGHTDAVFGLSEAGADIHSADNYERTPLLVAACNGFTDTVHILCKSGVGINKADNDGRVPLWAAAQNGYTNTVLALIEAGADIHSADNDGWTPLAVAAYYGHADLVHVLFNVGADIHKANTAGRTPLRIAAYNGHADTVLLLFYFGAYINKADNNGRSPLWVAAENGHVDTVLLLIHAGANINKTDNVGCAPIHRVILNRNTVILKLLLDHNADIYLKNSNGQNAIDLANSQSNSEVQEMIYAHHKKFLYFAFCQLIIAFQGEMLTDSVDAERSLLSSKIILTVMGSVLEIPAENVKKLQFQLDRLLIQMACDEYFSNKKLIIPSFFEKNGNLIIHSLPKYNSQVKEIKKNRQTKQVQCKKTVKQQFRFFNNQDYVDTNVGNAISRTKTRMLS